jgi:hypothetical protein
VWGRYDLLLLPPSFPYGGGPTWLHVVAATDAPMLLWKGW